jgi:hypothetical protein
MISLVYSWRCTGDCRLDGLGADLPEPDLLLGLGESLDLDLLLCLGVCRLVDLLGDVDLADLLDLELDSIVLMIFGSGLSMAGVVDGLAGALKILVTWIDSPCLTSKRGRPRLAGVPPLSEKTPSYRSRLYLDFVGQDVIVRADR